MNWLDWLRSKASSDKQIAALNAAGLVKDKQIADLTAQVADLTAKLAAQTPVVSPTPTPTPSSDPTSDIPYFTPPGKLIWSDDFESGTPGTSLSGGGINYSDNSSDGLTPGPQPKVRYSTAQAYQGKQSCEFFYSGNGKTGPCIGYRAELRFNLGASYTEVTWDCYQRVPDNFKHYASGSSNNNKVFRLAPTSAPDPANGYERFGASWERDNDNSSGVIGDWDTHDSQMMTQRGTYTPGVITTALAGQWVRQTVYCKAATATEPGYLKMWWNGTLVLNERPNIYDAASSHDIRHGYWWGAFNGYVDGDTSWFMDQLRVYGK